MCGDLVDSCLSTNFELIHFSLDGFQRKRFLQTKTNVRAATIALMTQ